MLPLCNILFLWHPTRFALCLRFTLVVRHSIKSFLVILPSLQLTKIVSKTSKNHITTIMETMVIKKDQQQVIVTKLHSWAGRQERLPLKKMKCLCKSCAFLLASFSPRRFSLPFALMIWAWFWDLSVALARLPSLLLWESLWHALDLGIRSDTNHNLHSCPASYSARYTRTVIEVVSDERLNCSLHMES
jgi:hypothetical protein